MLRIAERVWTCLVTSSCIVEVLRSIKGHRMTFNSYGIHYCMLGRYSMKDMSSSLTHEFVRRSVTNILLFLNNHSPFLELDDRVRMEISQDVLTALRLQRLILLFLLSPLQRKPNK